MLNDQPKIGSLKLVKLHLKMAGLGDELTLLERVFLRIGSAETDDQLENAIAKFLPPVLLKLSSPQEGVRKKVMELLIHINKRVKSRPQVQLPVEALLAQYQDPAATSFVINFTIIYLKTGYPRLPAATQSALAPALLSALASKPALHRDALLLALMPALGHVTKAASFGEIGPETRSMLADFVLDTLLLPYGALLPSDDSGGTATGGSVPPGLSEHGFRRVSGETQPRAEDIEQTKVGLVRFLALGVLSDSEILVPLAVASADTRFGVANTADTHLKKIIGGLDWTKPSLTTPLMRLFLGGSREETQLRRSPANTRIRLKLMPLILRARGPAVAFPECIQVFFDCLYGSMTNARLKNMALQFAMLIIDNAAARSLATVSTVLCSGLLKLVSEPGEDRDLRGLAFRAVGKLANKQPSLVSNDMALLQTFFDALNTEDSVERGAVREALLNMADAFAFSPAQDEPAHDAGPAQTSAKASPLDKRARLSDDFESRQRMLRQLLATQLASREPAARFVAVRYTSTAFSAHDEHARYLLLTATADSKEEVSAEALRSLYGTPEDSVTLPAFTVMAHAADRAIAANLAPAVVTQVYSSAATEAATAFSPATSAACGDTISTSQPRDADTQVVGDIIEQLKDIGSPANGKVSPLAECSRDGSWYSEAGGVRLDLATDGNTVHVQIVESVPRREGVLACQGWNVTGFVPFDDTRDPFLLIGINDLEKVLVYLRKCLWASAGQLDWRTLPAHPCQRTPAVGKYLRALATGETSTDFQAVEKHLKLSLALLDSQASSHAALDALAELVGLAPSVTAKLVAAKLATVKLMLSSHNEDVRKSSALLYALLISHGLDSNARASALAELSELAGAASATLESRHGAVLALGRTIERRLADIAAGAVGEVEGFSQATDAILGQLECATHPLLVGAACVALGEMTRRAKLPLDETRYRALVARLQAISGDSKTQTKVKERATAALGLLCVGHRFELSREVIDHFLGTARNTGDLEMHLAVGHALACCVEGPRSAESRDAWLVAPDDHATDEPMDSNDDADLEHVIEQLLGKMAADPHPNAKQAVCIWLLSVCRRCGARPALRARWERCQGAFMDSLASDSDIVQDAASKGLALVYEQSDEVLRKRLVADLLDTLTSGRRAVAQVNPETKLFEEGQLGTAPTGGNLSTYKELCSLASDLNQPDLIYKFMHLANHNALWNSKKGAAFGFFSIAVAANSELTEHLPRIVPRLYRYQFDPTPKIQLAMTSIWQALVPEGNKAIERYRCEILSDLLANLTSSQWRVRTSCCLALSELLRGPAGPASLTDSLGSLAKLWTELFRVMDDVHEGTRTAAGNTARVLAKLCVRLADSSNGKTGVDLVTVILPPVLDIGVVHTVPEVRAVSVDLVSQLVRSAGSQLAPNLPTLVPALLSAAGDFDAVGFGGLSSRLAADEDAHQAVDSIRADIAKKHRTTEVVAKCVQLMNADVLSELIPRVVELMKGSVALGTRVACAHFLVLLVSQFKAELRPYAGKLVSVLSAGLLDRNTAVRRQYAIALGHVCAAAPDAVVQKLLAKLHKWYMDKEDDSVRLAVAVALRALGRHAGELIKDHADVVAPLAFFALHAARTQPANTTDPAVEAWEDVWSEVTPGTESGVRNHAADIVRLLTTALSSPSWTMKAQAANTAAAACKNRALSFEHRKALAEALLAGLPGRTWTGKERMLNALAVITSNCTAELRQDSALTDAMVEALLRECRKEAPAYKAHALRSLGQMLQALELDHFAQVHQIVQGVLEKDGTPGANDSDSDDDSTKGGKSQAQLDLKEACYETLGKAWPSDPKTQAVFQEALVAQCLHCLALNTRPVQVAILAALARFVDKLCLLDTKPSADNRMDISPSTETSAEPALQLVLNDVAQAVEFALAVPRHTRLRAEALNVLLILGRKLASAERVDQLAELARRFAAALDVASADNAPEIKSRVVDVKNILNSKT